MNILQDIFCDHYEIIEYTCHPRDVEMENISKMIHCGDPSFGGALYCCGKCGHTKFVPFRCHSLFCPTCGALYSVKRTTAMSFMLIRCPHRHCVFTIAEELRPFSQTAPFLTACSKLLIRSFPVSSTTSTTSEILFPVLSVSCIPLAVTLSGIRISIASFPKVLLTRTAFGVPLLISITSSSVMLFKPFS